MSQQETEASTLKEVTLERSGIAPLLVKGHLR